MAWPRDYRWTLVPTPLGPLGLVASPRGISELLLPPDCRQNQARLEATYGPPAEDSAIFGELPLRLQRYARGERVAFPDPLDLSHYTPFQRAVWQVTRSVPWGERRSYRWVAEQLGQPRATRAVGQALHANPVPILVPCHRIVAGDGSLCGYRGGLDLKERLLVLERGDAA